MTKDELIAWAKANGWSEDRYGHLQKTSCVPEGCPREVKTYRLKLSSIAARYEVKTSFGWVRLRSGYYKNLSISAGGKLAGMTR
jgi:hypothetical protein